MGKQSFSSNSNLIDLALKTRRKYIPTSVCRGKTGRPTTYLPTLPMFC